VNGDNPADFSVAAMAQYQLGKKEKARQVLQRARKSMEDGE